LSRCRTLFFVGLGCSDARLAVLAAAAADARSDHTPEQTPAAPPTPLGSHHGLHMAHKVGLRTDDGRVPASAVGGTRVSFFRRPVQALQRLTLLCLPLRGCACTAPIAPTAAELLPLLGGGGGGSGQCCSTIVTVTASEPLILNPTFAPLGRDQQPRIDALDTPAPRVTHRCACVARFHSSAPIGAPVKYSAAIFQARMPR
jgi:hypothetical protein